MAKTRTRNDEELEQLANKIASLEQQLAEQDSVFQQLAEEVGNGYWRWIVSTNDLQISSRLCQFLGHTSDPDQEQQPCWNDILSADDSTKLNQKVGRLRPNKNSNFEL
ncbi:MAG: hypothetical protein AAF223_15800, partial [Bacteroidota bacterium]